MNIKFDCEVTPKVLQSIPGDVGDFNVMLKDFPRVASTVFGAKSIQWLPRQALAIEVAEGVKLVGPGRDPDHPPSEYDMDQPIPIFAQDITKEVENHCGMRRTVGMGGAKMYAATTLKSMYKEIGERLNRMDPRGPCFYELIRGAPSKLYFDLEVELDHNPGFIGEFMDVTFRADLRKFLIEEVSSVLFSNEAATPILRVDASTARKWSSHYIVPACFENCNQVGGVARTFIKKMIEKYGTPNDSRRNPYFLEKTDKCTDGYVYKWAVDMSVYNTNRVFRSCGCSKAGDASRIFIYVAPGEKAEDIAAKKAKGYIPSFKHFVECMAQDHLYNALWLRHYKSYIKVLTRDGMEFGTMGVSRLSLFDEGIGEAFYQRIERHMVVSTGSSSSSSSSSSTPSPSGKNVMAVLHERMIQGGPEDTHMRPYQPPSSFYRPGQSEQITWENGLEAKKRRLALGCGAGLSKFVADKTVQTNAGRGLTVLTQVDSTFSASVTDTIINAIRELAKIVPSRSGCFIQHGMIMLRCEDTYCNQKEAHHRTPKSCKLFIDPFNLILRQECWKGGCVSSVSTSESKMWPSWHLRTAIPKKAAAIVSAVRYTVKVSMDGGSGNDKVADYSILDTREILQIGRDFLRPNAKERKKETKKGLEDLYALMYQENAKFIEDNDLPSDFERAGVSTTMDVEDEEIMKGKGDTGLRFARWEVRLLRRMDVLEMGVQ